MRACRRCGGSVEEQFRYCPSCALPQRVKVTEFFRAHPLVQADRGKALRISRYLDAPEQERHVRFSVWNESGEAEAAVSLDELEAARLSGFLLSGAAQPVGVHGLGAAVRRLRAGPSRARRS